MIQFNLLPDIKLEYIKARRIKRTLTFIAFIASGATVAIMLILFLGVQVFQAKNLRDINKDIDAKISEIESFQDLDKVLTIQNQLNSLPGLHDQKPIATRLYTYLPQVVPKNVSIALLDLSFIEQTITITGSADSIETINKFVDTLKFAEYELSSEEGSTKAKAFNSVVLESFGKSENKSGFSIILKYDPLIFDVKSKVKLVVPKGLITTRSENEKPDDNLFKPLNKEEQEELN
jgi:Tfp pilus assembly protein PilN